MNTKLQILKRPRIITMAKDPAFLYYDADASRDVAHMNRLERGAYLDIIHAQKKFGRLTFAQVQKVLGNDFEFVWTAIEMVLTKDDEKYFIEWVETSIEKRKTFAKKQSERIKNYYNNKGKSTTVEPRLNQTSTEPIPNLNQTSTTVEPYVNENEIVLGNKGLNNNTGEAENFEPVEPPPLIEGFYKLSDLKSICLKDKTFVETFYRQGIREDELSDWLDAFNRMMAYKSKHSEQEHEYRRYFGNWLKYPRGEGIKPKEYSPVGKIESKPQIQSAEDILAKRYGRQ